MCVSSVCERECVCVSHDHKGAEVCVSSVCVCLRERESVCVVQLTAVFCFNSVRACVYVCVCVMQHKRGSSVCQYEGTGCIDGR